VEYMDEEAFCAHVYIVAVGVLCCVAEAFDFGGVC